MPDRLTNYLVEQGVITPDAETEAIQRQVLMGGAIDTALLELELADEESILKALDAIYESDIASRQDLARTTSNRAVRAIPEQWARRRKIAPLYLAEDSTKLTVLSPAPADQALLNRWGELLELELTPILAPEFRIEERLAILYEAEPDERFKSLIDIYSDPLVSFQSNELSSSESLDFAAAVTRLKEPSSRDAIARTTLKYVGRALDFSALFIVQDGFLEGWMGKGPGADKIRGASLPVGTNSAFRVVLDTKAHYLGPLAQDESHDDFLNYLQRNHPRSVLIAPIRLQERTVALLYADNAATEIPTRTANDVMLFVSHVQSALLSLLLRRKTGNSFFSGLADETTRHQPDLSLPISILDAPPPDDAESSSESSAPINEAPPNILDALPDTPKSASDSDNLAPQDTLANSDDLEPFELSATETASDPIGEIEASPVEPPTTEAPSDALYGVEDAWSNNPRPLVDDQIWEPMQLSTAPNVLEEPYIPQNRELNSAPSSEVAPETPDILLAESVSALLEESMQFDSEESILLPEEHTPLSRADTLVSSDHLYIPESTDDLLSFDETLSETRLSSTSSVIRYESNNLSQEESLPAFELPETSDTPHTADFDLNPNNSLDLSLDDFPSELSRPLEPELTEDSSNIQVLSELSQSIESEILPGPAEPVSHPYTDHQEYLNQVEQDYSARATPLTLPLDAILDPIDSNKKQSEDSDEISQIPNFLSVDLGQNLPASETELQADTEVSTQSAPPQDTQIIVENIQPPQDQFSPPSSPLILSSPEFIYDLPKIPGADIATSNSEPSSTPPVLTEQSTVSSSEEGAFSLTNEHSPNIASESELEAKVAAVRSNSAVDTSITHQLDSHTSQAVQSNSLNPTPKPLNQIAETELNQQIELLGSKEKRVRTYAQEILAEAGESALPLLIERFPGPLVVNPFAPEVILPAFTDCGPLLTVLTRHGRNAHVYVDRRLDVPDPIIRFFATYFYSAAYVPEAVPRLVQRLHDEEARICMTAARTLFGYRSHSAFGQVVEHLHGRLSASSVAARRHAAFLIGLFRDVSAVPELIEVVERKERALLDVAEGALAEITKQRFGTNVRKWRSWWAKNEHRNRIEWLIEGLASRDAAIRRSAFDELKAVTGQDIDYNPQDSKRRREEARRKWLQWWQKEGMVLS